MVCFISTFMKFYARILDGVTTMVEKPIMIKDFNKNMGGVDIYDQMLMSYVNERKI